MPRPTKRTKLLSDDEGSADESGFASSSAAKNGFSINAEFAKRFEHNKKREEKQRLEEKYGKDFGNKRPRHDEDEDDEDDEESSTSEEEDDDAELATADVDAEIMDTLQAIRNKDPRVYDKEVKFYKEFDPDSVETTHKDKPMYLRDYHRENLLKGHVGEDLAEDAGEPIRTYQQEQDSLRDQLVGSMHATANEAPEDSGEDEFLVKKAKQKHESLPTASRPAAKRITNNDIAAAEKDPETYLSNFMAARAWLPTDGSSRFAPMESDDSEDDEKAEMFEEAYNMRFEDPKMANERLQTFSRDVGKYGVRREETSSRKKTRDREREKKEAEKLERREEKARLRKLKIDEVEEKVAKIKEAAGLTGQDIDISQWRDIIEGDFDDDQWDEEMVRRFGDKYYEHNDGEKVKKPKWDDDIDINDLVPDFEEDGGVRLSGQEDEDVDEVDGGAQLDAEAMDVDSEGEQVSSKTKTSKKDREKAKAEAKRAARKQRMQIESLVDESLATSVLPSSSKGPAIGFRYRATSPTSFGLTTRDILFADDKQLNEFAGLKKLAAFRDEEKKRRDKKKFSKKARLRQWRKDTFGDMDGPKGEFSRGAAAPAEQEASGVDIREGEKKKKRRHKKKTVESTTGDA